MIYLLNGPPRSGKDSAAKFIRDHFGIHQCAHVKLAGVLKRRTHALYGLVDLHGHPLRADFFEDVKEEPREEFGGLTPRAAYIAVHRYLSDHHGTDVLGRLLIARSEVWRDRRANYVVSDVGSREQCQPILDTFGPENVVLIRLRRDGCEWDNRRRVEIPEALVSYEVDNNGTLEELKETILRCLE